MNKLGRILLLVGGLVLALLIGVLIGRGQRAEPTSERDAAAVQITTAAPPAPPPPPLPAPVRAPTPAAIPKIAPDVQVQEDAAAVGMTTRDADQQAPADAAPPAKSATAGGDAGASEPIG